MAAVLPRRTAAADRASISSAHERSKLCLRQEFMKLPSFAVCLWAALWGNSDHKLRPEKFLWMYFRTGVQLSSSPPCRNGLCSIPIFLFCKKNQSYAPSFLLFASVPYRHKYLYSSAFPKRKNRLISSGFYFSLHVFKQSFCFIQQESAVLFTALLKLKLSIICW